MYRIGLVPPSSLAPVCETRTLLFPPLLRFVELFVFDALFEVDPVALAPPALLPFALLAFKVLLLLPVVALVLLRAFAALVVEPAALPEPED
jgi:hypothetical protein